MLQPSSIFSATCEVAVFNLAWVLGIHCVWVLGIHCVQFWLDFGKRSWRLSRWWFSIFPRVLRHHMRMFLNQERVQLHKVPTHDTPCSSIYIYIMYNVPRIGLEELVWLMDWWSVPSRIQLASATIVSQNRSVTTILQQERTGQKTNSKNP